MDAKIFRINYKSDFILTLTSDAGWMTPFCIKFWTGAPSQAFYAQWDGETYTHCAYDPSEPTKLVVQFDDHHLPIGELKYQVAYHFTVDDFPNDTEDEVLNPGAVTTEIDGEEYQVMLDFTGETAPEIQFSLPAYANEAQRIANEQQRIANEQQRISNEAARIAAEQTRQQNETQRISREQARQTNEAQRIEREQARQTNEAQRIEREQARQTNEGLRIQREQIRQEHEAQRIANETERVTEFAGIKTEAVAATNAANAAASLANEKAEYAKEQGDYAKAQGDYAKEQGTIAEEDHVRAESDHTRAESDHAAVEVYVDSLGAFDISSYHATGGVLAKYADLTAALGTNGTNVPEAIRKGGMSVKFVQSFDNKYVQYRLMSNSFNTTESNWQGVDDEPTAGSDNLVKSGGMIDVYEENQYIEVVVDKERKILESRDITGKKTIYTDVKIEGDLQSETLDALESRVNVNIDQEISDRKEICEFSEKTYREQYSEILIDTADKILESRDLNGKKTIHTDVNIQGAIEISAVDGLSIQADVDSEDKIHHQVLENGVHDFPAGIKVAGENYKETFAQLIRNENHQWTRTVISYKKPNTEIDNVSNFDNLMAACIYAYNHATAIKQFDIEVYEDIFATEESDFTPIPESPIHSGIYDYNALFYTNDYIRIRGIGYPKTISARMKKAGFTTNRTLYQPGYYQGGDLENLKVVAENVKYAIHYETNAHKGENGHGYIRECEFIHYGGENELWGNETNLYSSWNAWGCGMIEGNLLKFDKCSLISYSARAFSVHGNTNKIPVEINFDSCFMIGQTYGLIVEHPLTGSDKLSLKLTNNYIYGNTYGLSIFCGTATNQINIRIYGCNNKFNSFYGGSDKTLRFDAISTTDICRLIQDDASVFGNSVVMNDAEFGVSGSIIGNSGILALNSRIGDCRETPKLLVFLFGETTKTVTFSQDYTNMSNSDILNYINAELSSYGVVSEWRRYQYYYPEFTDIIVEKKNNGNEIIQFGDYVAIDGMNVTKLSSSENADAICVDAYSVGIGQIGKFRTNIN